MAQLTHEQARQVHDALFSLANYLVRLRHRVEKTFKPTDPKLLELVEAKRKVAEFRGRFPFGTFLVSAATAKRHAPNTPFTELSECDDLEYRTLEEQIKSLMAELKIKQRWPTKRRL